MDHFPRFDLSPRAVHVAPPTWVMDAAREALERSWSTAASDDALATLIAAECEKRAPGLRRESARILFAPGSRALIAAILAALAAPGDEIAVLEPAWPGYSRMMASLGLRPRGLPWRGLGKGGWDADMMRDALQPRPALALINTPHSPTGDLAGASIFDMLAPCGDMPVILDTISEGLSWDERDAPPTLPPALLDRLILVGSASKSLALGDWRFGWAWVPAPWHGRVAGALDALAGPPTRPTLELMRAIWPRRDELLRHTLRQLRPRRRALLKALGDKAALDLHVGGHGFTIVGQARSGDGDALASRLLSRGVLAAPGSSYGEAFKALLVFSFGAPQPQIEGAAPILTDLLGSH